MNDLNCLNQTVSIRGQLPDVSKMLDKEDFTIMKRAIFATQRQCQPPICTHNMLEDASDPILNCVRRIGLFNSSADRVKVCQTLQTQPRHLELQRHFAWGFSHFQDLCDITISFSAFRLSSIPSFFHPPLLCFQWIMRTLYEVVTLESSPLTMSLGATHQVTITIIIIYIIIIIIHHTIIQHPPTIFFTVVSPSAECTVMGIPSVSTNLSGFGCFMEEHIADPSAYGPFHTLEALTSLFFFKAKWRVTSFSLSQESTSWTGGFEGSTSPATSSPPSCSSSVSRVGANGSSRGTELSAWAISWTGGTSAEYASKHTHYGLMIPARHNIGLLLFPTSITYPRVTWPWLKHFLKSTSMNLMSRPRWVQHLLHLFASTVLWDMYVHS